MRRKNIVKTIATIGMSVLFFFLISEMESRINSMLSMDGVFIEMDEAMKKEMLPLFYFGKAAAEGDFKSFIIFADGCGCFCHDDIPAFSVFP